MYWPGNSPRRHCEVKRYTVLHTDFILPWIFNPVNIKYPLNKQSLHLCCSHAVATATERQRSAGSGRMWQRRLSSGLSVSVKHFPSLRQIGRHLSIQAKLTNAETNLTKSSGSRSGLTPRESSTSFRIWSNSSESSPKVSQLGSLPLSVRNFRSTGKGKRREVKKQVFRNKCL